MKKVMPSKSFIATLVVLLMFSVLLTNKQFMSYVNSIVYGKNSFDSIKTKDWTEFSDKNLPLSKGDYFNTGALYENSEEGGIMRNLFGGKTKTQSVGSSGGGFFSSNPSFSTDSTGAPSSYFAESESMNMKDTIGFKVGNDQDTQLFRENIMNGFIPNSDVLTYNGVFGDYHFDLPEGECEDMFCPLVSAGSVDVKEGEKEYRVQVGLGSNIKEKDFKRPNTNFVFVLDISGSMGGGLNSYYYDDVIDEYWEYCNDDQVYFKPSQRCLIRQEAEQLKEEYEEESKKSKITLATETLSELVKKLNPEDRIGIVLYESTAVVAHPMIKVNKIDLDKLSSHILEITDRGGTNMESGMKLGLDFFNDDVLSEEGIQNRIVFLTDAMPNIGADDPYSLGGMVADAVSKGIYFTFMGVGVDFQQQFIQKLSKHEGTNYFYISDSWDFRKRLLDEFDYNFFPMIFGLKFTTEDADRIEKVYGVDGTNFEKEGEIIKINTLFPTPPTDDGYRGSIILLKLKEKLTEDMKFDVEFKKFLGEDVESEFVLDSEFIEQEGSNSMKKGVILIKYLDSIKYAINDSEPETMESIIDMFQNNKSIFSGDDEKVMKKEIEVIDKLFELIESDIQVKKDYWNDF